MHKKRKTILRPLVFCWILIIACWILILAAVIMLLAEHREYSADSDGNFKTKRAEWQMVTSKYKRLEIEVTSDTSIEVKIDSQEVYEEFLLLLKDYKEYTSLTIDVQGTDTVI